MVLVKVQLTSSPATIVSDRLPPVAETLLSQATEVA